ncbi:putative quinol monooxygenase [Nocardia sp. NPDC003482]
MAIRHIITIRVAPGCAAEFEAAFAALAEVVRREPGCEQYELFRGTGDPDTFVMLERWTDRDLLAAHQRVERADNAPLVEALMALWAPGSTPTVEAYES